MYIYFTAPGSYDVEKVENTVHQSSPAYSFGVKYKEREQENLPGNVWMNISKDSGWSPKLFYLSRSWKKKNVY